MRFAPRLALAAGAAALLSFTSAAPLAHAGDNPITISNIEVTVGSCTNDGANVTVTYDVTFTDDWNLELQAWATKDLGGGGSSSYAIGDAVQIEEMAVGQHVSVQGVVPEGDDYIIQIKDTDAESVWEEAEGVDIACQESSPSPKPSKNSVPRAKTDGVEHSAPAPLSLLGVAAAGVAIAATGLTVRARRNRV